MLGFYRTLTLATLFLWASYSFAQNNSIDRTYLLIENSESMWEYRDDAVADVERRVRAMSAGELVSVEIFSGDDVDDCAAPVSIPKPAAPVLDFELDPPASSGSTIISNALSELAKNHDVSGATIFVYTDGKYDGPSCDSLDSLCEQFLILNKGINPPQISFVLPGLQVLSAEEFLKCSALSEGEEKEGEEAVPLGPWFYAALFAWLTLPVSLFSYLAVQNLSMRRYTDEVLQQAESFADFDPNSDEKAATSNTTARKLPSKISIKKKTSLEKFWGGALIAIFLLATILVICRPERWTALSWLWMHGNERLPAGVISAAIPAMAAWYLVELYRIGDARRQWQWQVSHQAIELEKREREVTIELEKIRQKRDQFHERLDRSTREGSLEADNDVLNRTAAIASKMESVFDVVQYALEHVRDVRSLKNLKPSSRGYYSTVCRFLVEHRLLSEDDRKSITALITAWESYVRALPELRSDIEQRVLEYEIPELTTDSSDEEAESTSD